MTGEEPRRYFVQITDPTFANTPIEALRIVLDAIAAGNSDATIEVVTESGEVVLSTTAGAA